jgi:hypothetical protein
LKSWNRLINWPTAFAAEKLGGSGNEAKQSKSDFGIEEKDMRDLVSCHSGSVDRLHFNVVGAIYQFQLKRDSS